jgi:dihydrofolate reductase
MTVTAIAAVAENGAIGLGGRLPWHLPADLARFKKLTHGHHLIVGRKTWESIGRPLPGRTFLVVSRGAAPSGWEGAWFGSVAEAVERARELEDAQPFVAGGSGVFREAFERDLVDRIELTRVHAELPGDAFFPPFDGSRFVELERAEHPADARNRYAQTFVTLDRRPR